MNRRLSHPTYRSYQFHNDHSNSEETVDRDDESPNGYGQLEAATLESEISMSVVTDDTRLYNEQQRHSMLRRQNRRSLDVDTEYEETVICCNAVNVEPVLFLFSVSIGFLLTSQPLFTYWARCVEIAKDSKGNDEENITSICAVLSGSNNTLQNKVERDISSMKIWLQISNSVPTLIIAPLIGSWSDKIGRKRPLIYSVVGFLFYNIFQLIATLTYKFINIYYWFFLSEIIIGCTGGISSMFATSLAIVTDNCRNKLKPGSSTVPLRIGVASFVESFGNLLGTFTVSILAVPAIKSIIGHEQSYIKSAFIQTGTAFAALLYAILFVKETHFPQSYGFEYSQFDNSSSDLSQSEQSLVQNSDSILYRFKENICSLFKVLTEPRPGWARICLIMSLFFVFVEFLALDSSLLFLLVKRQPFAWSDSLFSYFSLIRGFLLSLGMIICPLSLTFVHWLGKDSLMIIFGIAASSISYFLISQAETTTEIFMTTALALLCGAIGPGYRAFLPRMVPKDQTARLLTVCSIIVAFCPIVSSIIFNTIFNLSLDWWPGFVFFVGGVMQIVAVIGQLCVHILMRPQWKMAKLIKQQQQNHIQTDEVIERPMSSEGEVEENILNTSVEVGLQFESPRGNEIVIT